MKDMNGRDILPRDVVAYAKVLRSSASLGYGVVVATRDNSVSIKPIKQRHKMSEHRNLIPMWVPENVLIIKRENNVQSSPAQVVHGPVVASGGVVGVPVVGSGA